MVPANPAQPNEELLQGKRELLRHTVATLAYRAAKAVRGAHPDFAHFRSAETTRTPLQILAHLADLFDWALALAENQHRWNPVAPTTWDADSKRFFTALARFDAYLASDRPLGWSAERLFQGPVADALTHVGQLTMLRRLAGLPIRGENYARAEIVVGRVTADQASSKIEFD